MGKFLSRIVRAMRLDVTLYEEVEADQTALKQAMLVVVLSSIASGIGSAGDKTAGAILLATVINLLAWYFWAFLTFLIGTKIFPEPQTSSNTGELLRTTGFSSAPGLLWVLGIIPGIRVIVFIVSALWMLVAMVIAVRQALDYTKTWRAIVVCLIGWMIQRVFLVTILYFLK